MWLRDSQNQVMPYIRFARQEPEGIGSLLRGLIDRHVDSVLADPYANSFSFSPADIACNAGAWLKDNTTRLDAAGRRVNGMSTAVHQRKWEVDLLPAPEARANVPRRHGRRATSGRQIYRRRKSHRGDVPSDAAPNCRQFHKSQLHVQNADYGAQRYEPSRHWASPQVDGDDPHFLPSDDSPRFNYHIPGNAFASYELSKMADILGNISASHLDLVAEMRALSSDIDAGIRKHGIVMHGSGKRIYAMEVDGFGNYFFADDANPPSLLSLPLIAGIDAGDKVYRNTRARLSADTNPFSTARATFTLSAQGVGSEDASGNAGWARLGPLSAIRLLTIDDADPYAADEATWVLRGLVKSSGSTGLMHESFWYSDPLVPATGLRWQTRSSATRCWKRSKSTRLDIC